MQEVPLSVKTWRWCLQVDWGLEVVKGSGAVDFAAFKAARLLWHSISMKHTESGNKDYLFLFDTLKSQICLAPIISSWVYLLNCCDGALLCRGHFHDVAAGGIWLAVLHLPCCDEAHQPLLPHWGKAHWLIGPWVSAVWKVLQHSQGPVCPQIKVPASMNKLSLTCKHFFWSSCWGQIYALLLGSNCSNFALAKFPLLNQSFEQEAFSGMRWTRRQTAWSGRGWWRPRQGGSAPTAAFLALSMSFTSTLSLSMWVSASSVASVISLAKVGMLCSPTDIDITAITQTEVPPRKDK